MECIKTSDSSSDTVELLLDHDLPGDTAWVSLEDYQAAGGTAEEYGSNGNNKYGPITALKHLKEATDSWNGVVTLTSADNVTRDNGSGGNYTINYEGYKARLISGQELADIAGEYWPPSANTILLPSEWLYNNMAFSIDYENSNLEISDIYEHQFYWTDSAYNRDGSVFDRRSTWMVLFNGTLSVTKVSSKVGIGVRPVVRILKSNL